ncbi:amidophosphoribosyltransferase [Salinicola rhizosphaerae]|uniref:Amidophosphoribosyltransferase n=2 Tax=Salinicola rhizosphaerae TaxID=1443141 RepID=A0ABQ3E512_9GAMM|nr:amidophosphoribosyltransferase [Salinicola rhizosphaerae]
MAEHGNTLLERSGANRQTALKWRFRRLLRGVNAALEQALPGYCTFCHAPVGGDATWCQACYGEMPWNRHACECCGEPLGSATASGRLCGHCLRRPPAMARTLTPLRYEGRMIALVQRFKFSADPRAGEVMIRLLTAALQQAQRRFPRLGEAIVAVPGQRERTHERGFDHAAWLARRLADRLELPLIPARRLAQTPSQRGLDRRARRRNVKDAFVVAHPLPASVIVVDDVMTTGATLDALARACRKAGAESVTALALARTPSARI